MVTASSRVGEMQEHRDPARAEPRETAGSEPIEVSRCDDSHHFAGGQPAAAIVEERTARAVAQARVSACVDFPDPLPRRDLVAASSSRRTRALGCERVGLKQPALYRRSRVQRTPRKKFRGGFFTPSGPLSAPHQDPCLARSI